ncbi:MAG: hypothetical protein JJE17_07305 [Peptostreptococcaceae bacterium]|nr:hypothetical protein [Peptostreptococcaceae bacterium]
MRKREPFCSYPNSQGWFMPLLFFYTKQRKTNLKAFCQYVKVKPNTYFFAVLERYYRYHTNESYKVNKLYRKFYKHEYASLEDFLEQHFCLPRENATKLANNYSYVTELKVNKYNSIQQFEQMDEEVLDSGFSLFQTFYKDMSNEN